MSLILSWSVALAPLNYGFKAVAQTPPMDPVAALSKDLTELTTRAIYPDIPRRGRTGKPDAAELAEIQRRLSERLHTLNQKANAELRYIQDDSLELALVMELEQCYGAIQKFETLKLLSGVKIDPATWEQLYKIRVPISDLSHSKFIEASGGAGELRVMRTDLDRAVVSSMRTRMTGLNSDPAIEFRLNPNFLENAERQALLVTPGTEGVLWFGVHFAAHRLFDSDYSIKQLTPAAEPLAPVSPAWRGRFASLAVKEQETQLRIRRAQSGEQKRILLEATAGTQSNLSQQPGFWALDDDFFKALAVQLGKPEVTVNHEAVRKNEEMSFAFTLLRMADLWQPGEPAQEWRRLLFLAKRMSLRWLVLNNPELTAGLSPDGQDVISAMIDARADAFATLQSGALGDAYARAANINGESLRREARRIYAEGLSAMAVKLGFMENHNVNLSYLIGMEKSRLEALKVSPAVQLIIDGLAQQPAYENGYRFFVLNLATVLEYYTIPGQWPRTNPVSELMKVKDRIRFNGEGLRDLIPGAYVDALKANSGKRSKDVSDLFAIAQILRFDLFEKLQPEAQADVGGIYYAKRPTPKNLNLGERWFSSIRGQDFTPYREEIKKDVYTAAPLLGSNDLWQKLAHGRLHSSEEQKLIDQQLRSALQTSAKNLSTLEQSAQKLVSAQGDLSKVGEDIRTLVSRTSQLTFFLSQFAETAAYSQDIRRELLMPGYWEKEFERFSTWSNSYVNYMLGFVLVQLVGSRVQGVGKVMDSLGRFLAPVFGPNFSRVQPVIWGLIGVSTAQFAYKGWGPEAERAAILQNYFSCAAAGACVALYDDVHRQNQIRDSNQIQAVLQVALVGGIMGGFWLARKFMRSPFQGLGANAETLVARDMGTLNVEAGSVLTERTLADKLNQAVLRAKAHPDARVGAIAEAYAHQAHSRLHQMVWQESKRWYAFDQRFNPRLEQVGLSARSAKDQTSVLAALGRVESLHKDRAISYMRYLDLRGDLLAISSTMTPIWRAMEANKHVASFYTYVFDLSHGTVRAEIAGKLNYYNSQLNAQFTAAADDFLAQQFARPKIVNGSVEVSAESSAALRAASRLERLMERAAQEIHNNPQSAGQVMDNLLRLAARELK